MEGDNSSQDLIRYMRKIILEIAKHVFKSYGLYHSRDWLGGYTLLNSALRNNNLVLAKLLLMIGSTVNSVSLLAANTPLHFAAKHGDIEIVNMLLKQGANVNAKNEYGRTPLYNAVEHERFEIIQLLIAHDAYVNKSDEYELSTHQFATERRFAEFVECIFESDAYANRASTSTWNGNYAPLHLAARTGNTEIIKLLLYHGANINARAENNITPLYIASEGGFGDAVKLFLNRGADIIARTFYYLTPLYIATRKGHKSVVKLLLQYGANVNDKDTHGRTILNVAVTNGNSLMVKIILEYGPDINNESNRSCLKIAVCSNGGVFETIVEALVAYGFRMISSDIYNSELLYTAIRKGYSSIVEDLLKFSATSNSIHNFINEENFIPLHIAIKYKQEEISKLLISYGTDINAQDNAGKTPLYYAVKSVDFEFVKLLLNNGADASCDPELLHLAVRKKSAEIVNILLQHNVDVNASDERGRTALHFVVFQEITGHSHRDEHRDDIIKEKITRMLLSNGANVDAQTHTGFTILHAASKKGYLRIVKVLLEYDVDVNLCDITKRSALHFITSYENVNASQSFTTENPNIFFKDKIARLLLTNGADVNAQTICGSTPLHIACEKGYLRIVKALLEFNADVNLYDIYERTALHLVTSHENNNSSRRFITESLEILTKEKIVRMLLSKGANVNAQTDTGLTALHTSSEKGYYSIVTVLLQYNADVNLCDKEERTALHFVTSHENNNSSRLPTIDNPNIFIKEKIVRLLLSKGAHVNAQTKSGLTTLHIACEKGYLRIVKLLLEYNADVNLCDILERTALHFITEHKNMHISQSFTTEYPNIYFKEKIARILLSKGANVNAQTDAGLTTLHIACEKGYLRIIQLLLEYNADVNLCDIDGLTALHWNVKSEKKFSSNLSHDHDDIKVKIARMLLSKGANVNAQSENGLTALHIAAEGGYLNVIEVLIGNGAYVNLCDSKGITALHLNIMSENEFSNNLSHEHDDSKEQITRLLLRMGANINAQSESGLTALHIAAERGYLDVIEVLLEHDADVNIYDIDEATALHFVALSRYECNFKIPTIGDSTNINKEIIARLLLGKGANVNAQAVNGVTALHGAIDRGFFDLVNVLLEYDADINICDIYEEAPLHVVAMRRDEEYFTDDYDEDYDIDIKIEIAKLLLNKGANVEAKIEGDLTALHVATQNGYTRLVETLLEHNANANCRTERGVTPLHVAAERNYHEIIEIILRFGGGLNSVDDYGRSPLIIAAKLNFVNVVTILLERGSYLQIILIDNKTILRPQWQVQDFVDVEDFNYFQNDFSDVDVTLNETIIDLIKHYIIKLISAGYVLCNKILEYSRTFNMREFKAECNEQLENMKRDKIGDSTITYYNILGNRTNSLSVCLGNEDIEQALRSENYKINYPLYAKLIQHIFEKATYRRVLQEKGNELLHSISKTISELPYDCINQITTYLSNYELRIFINSSLESEFKRIIL